MPAATGKPKVRSSLCVYPLLALFLLLSVHMAGCNRDAPPDEEGAARTVQVASVERGDLVESVSLVGELQGVEEVRVLAQVTDSIRRLAVREGDEVSKGDVLAVVESDLMSRALEQAEAGLEAATASRDALEREVVRIRTLVDAGSAPSSQMEGLQDQLEGARAQVRQAAAAVGQASAQQSRSVVRSPISGVVTAITAQEGEIAAPSMPLLTVVKPDELKVVLRAPERHFLGIKEGMRALITPLADRDIEVEAVVSLRGRVLDRMTRTGLVELVVENEEGLLVPGSAVRAVIETQRVPDVIVVPSEAVMFRGDTEVTGRAYVFVAEDDVAYRREVTIGSRQEGRIQILEGLTEGESIVVRGAYFLRDDTPIRAVEEFESRDDPGQTVAGADEGRSRERGEENLEAAPGQSGEKDR